MQSVQVSLWVDARGRERDGVEEVEGGLRAMIVLLVLQMHLQKEPGVVVRAEREGWVRFSRRRVRAKGRGRRRIFGGFCELCEMRRDTSITKGSCPSATSPVI